jgi:anti-sigma regulatory factor (Ser/Thr protein kinase)
VAPVCAQLQFRITSDPAEVGPARRRVEEFAASVGLDEPTAAQVGLCINEALANILRHAYGGLAGQPIQITLESDDAVLSIIIRDWGNGVDPQSIPPARYDPLQPGGVGLICLQQCMDEVRFEPQADGMVLRMKRAARRRGADAPVGTSLCR